MWVISGMQNRCKSNIYEDTAIEKHSALTNSYCFGDIHLAHMNTIGIYSSLSAVMRDRLCHNAAVANR